MSLKSNKIFLLSILSGLLIWLILYIVLPITNVESIKFETIGFVTINYTALILGFFSFKFDSKDKPKTIYDDYSLIRFLIWIIVFSYLLRWIDIFAVRDLSFDLAPKMNREISAASYEKTNMLFVLASILRGIYFFPFVIIMSFKSRKKIYLLISYIFLVFPLVEGFLKGTRKPFFEVFVIIILSLILFRLKKFKIKYLLIPTLAFVVLIFLSMKILFSREGMNTDERKVYLINARYNDLMPPKEYVKDYLLFSDNNANQKIAILSGLHFGQYIIHGFFELNHIMKKEKLSTTYGAYTFNTIPKFINKLKKGNTNIPITNPSPRKHVYLTTFGGFYIDFRWFSILLMFLIGVFQKYIFMKKNRIVLFRPLLVYIVIFNITLIMMNYIRGAGIYPIASILLLLPLIRMRKYI